MPGGKPAGLRCIHLTADYLCAIYRHPDRPAVCAALRPAPEMCGTSRGEALATLERLEALTAPDPQPAPSPTSMPPVATGARAAAVVAS
jgi:uncharacterized protein